MAKSVKAEKKSMYLGVRVRESTMTGLDDLANKHDRPVSWIVEKIIRRYLNLKD